MQFTHTVGGFEGSLGEPTFHSIRDYPKDADVVSAPQPYNCFRDSTWNGRGNLGKIAIGG